MGKLFSMDLFLAVVNDNKPQAHTFKEDPQIAYKD